MNRTSLWLTVCAAGITASLFGEISAQYRNWGDSALRYLMMTQEKTDWASLNGAVEERPTLRTPGRCRTRPSSRV